MIKNDKEMNRPVPAAQLGGSFLGVLTLLLSLFLGAIPALADKGFNEPGNVLIAEQFNNRVIRVSHGGGIVFSYGLPLDKGNNIGFDLHTTQTGLYAPYDAKIVGDYTGLTPPFDSDEDGDD